MAEAYNYIPTTVLGDFFHEVRCQLPGLGAGRWCWGWGWGWGMGMGMLGSPLGGAKGGCHLAAGCPPPAREPAAA